MRRTARRWWGARCRSTHPPFPSPASGRRSIPIASSSIRCRRPTASRSRSCWRRPACPTSRTWSSFETNDQLSPEFLSLNPNNKIPAILDPDGPGGKPLALFESGAILIYLADKTGKLMPKEPRGRYETMQWLMFQMGGIGPMFGQLGFFHKFAGKDYEDKRPRDRYVAEAQAPARRARSASRAARWIMGDDYTIADIATFPWVRNLIGFYEAGDLVGFEDFPHVKRVLEAFVARPAVVRGLNIPAKV